MDPLRFHCATLISMRSLASCSKPLIILEMNLGSRIRALSSSSFKDFNLIHCCLQGSQPSTLIPLVRAMPRLDNTYLLQDLVIAILLRQVQPCLSNSKDSAIHGYLPIRSIPILSKTQLLPAMTSLPLGTNPKASLLSASNANPRGFYIVSHDPNDNFLPLEAFL